MTDASRSRSQRLSWALGVLASVGLWASMAAGQDAGKVDAATKKLIAANGLLSRGLVRLAAEEYEGFLTKHAGHPQTTAARYGLAICKFRLSKYNEAVSGLRQVLKDGKFKQRDEALAVLGHCYLSTKAYAQALSVLDELLKKHADSKHAEVAALNRAQVLHLMGRYQDAVQACGQFVRKYPNSARRTSARYSLALAQFSLGKHAEAAATLARVLNTPNSPFALDATLLLGQCHEGLGKLDQAAAQYRKAIQLAPPDRQVEGYYSLGVALYRAGRSDERRYREAVDALKKALSVDRGGRYAKPARFQLGLAELAAGRLSDARKSLSAVARDDKDRAVQARYWLAQCDMTEKKYDAARATLDALARRKPSPGNLENILYDRAICTMALGRHEPAAREFQAFRRTYPKSTYLADATYREAFCLHKLRQYDRSYALCREVASLPAAAVRPAAAELAAENLFLLGRYDGAAKAFDALDKAAKDEARKLRLAFRLTQCAYFRGDYRQTIERARPLASNRKVPRDAVLRQAIFLLGDAYLQLGSHREAADVLKKYLPLASKEKAETQFKLGLAQLRSGDTAGAERAFAELIKGDQSSPWVLRGLFEYAQLAYKRDKTNRAVPALEKLLGANPPAELAAPSLYLKAWIDYDHKKYAEAAERFGLLAKRFPKHALAAEAKYQRGVCLVEEGKAADALAALQAYLKDHPGDKHARHARHHVGRCQAKLGKHADAIKVLSRLAADKATCTDSVLYELAWSQRETKDAAGAAKTYRRLLSEFPNSKLATAGRAELAELLYAQQQYAAAAGMLERVVADTSADKKTLAVARYRLGWCYAKQDQTAKAAEAFSAFSAAGADEEFAPSAMYQAGVAYAKLGKLEEAQKQFAALLARFGKHDLAPVAMLKLGEVQAQLQDYDRSGATYEAFLKQFPKSKFGFSARFGIGWSFENRRKYGDARRWYEKVIAEHNGPTAARAQFQIGECYFADGKFDKAAAELLKVEIVYAYPEWSARALYEAGRAFEALKQPQQARKQYAACVKKYAKTNPAIQAARRLEALDKQP
jgi:TolA-binding protein